MLRRVQNGYSNRQSFSVNPAPNPASTNQNQQSLSEEQENNQNEELKQQDTLQNMDTLRENYRDSDNQSEQIIYNIPEDVQNQNNGEDDQHPGLANIIFSYGNAEERKLEDQPLSSD